MKALAGSVRPAIAHGMLLQWEPAQEAHVLLYPEGMVKLNGTAAAILTRCDGARTLDDRVPYSADVERRLVRDRGTILRPV